MLQLTVREVLDLVVNDVFHIEWFRHVRRKLHTSAYVSVRQRTSYVLSGFDTSVSTLNLLFIRRIRRSLGGAEVEGVGVMKDEDLKFEEIETSITLG